MANPRTHKLRLYRSVMARIIRDNPDARKVENRYKLIRKCLQEVFPKTIEQISKETLLEMLRDTVTLDREARLHNEGNQTELKQQLSAERIVELKH